ncbi:MAG: hypothetical protein FJ125_11620, partial [Deltaproteobacteria bacterium]|nr:hypothetical protein [Deltaproteobacteria bacterium]
MWLRLTSVLLPVLSSLLLPALPARATVPRVLDFAGRLATEAGDYTGEAEITVTLYDDPLAQDAQHVLWSETQSVAVVAGRFQLLLGGDAQNPLPEAIGWAAALYAGVAVSPDPEMAPRLLVASVPYALRAADAVSVGGHGPEDFAAAQHAHDELYVGRDEAAGRFAAAGHDHDGAYYPRGDTDGRFAALAHDHDGVYVIQGREGSVTSAMIADGAIVAADLGGMGCRPSQVLKFDGQSWACAADMVGDTDTDTLAALVCQEGQLVRFDGSSWVCDDEQDALLALQCDEGQLLKRSEGAWACAEDADRDTVYTAGEGLTLGAGEFRVERAAIEEWARGAAYDSPAELAEALAGSYAAAGHDHDVAYHGKAEVEGLLAGKAAAEHAHPALYYDREEADLAFAASGHAHDVAYHGKAEVEGLLAGKADAEHAHPALYYDREEADLAFAAAGHDHDAAYAALGHLHDAAYYPRAAADLAFAAAGHAHDAAYAALEHLHDASYYPRAEADRRFYPRPEADAAFAASSHDHDAAYVGIGAADSIDSAMVL